MSDYDLESAIVSDKKRGVIPQRERNLPKKKNSRKYWVVYTRRHFCSGYRNSIHEWFFEKEEDAIKYAEKIRRKWLNFGTARYEDEAWVANNENLQEWKKEITSQRSSDS